MIAPAIVNPRIRSQVGRRITGLLLACLLGGASPAALSATLTVTTLEDSEAAASGECTLREAIASANNNTDQGDCVADTAAPYGDDVIRFAQSLFDDGNLPLELTARTQLTINDTGGGSLTLDGEIAESDPEDPENPAIATVAIDAANDGCSDEVATHIRAFHIQTAATLQNLLVTDGCAPASDSQGGALLVTDNASLTLDGVNIRQNIALDETTGDGAGGAIFVAEGSTLSITGSTLQGNTAGAGGGAIANESTALLGGAGGCPLAAESDFFSGDCTVALENVAFFGNIAGNIPEDDADSPILGNGGGLHNAGGIVAGRSVATTSPNPNQQGGNAATVSGGGIWNSGTGTIELLGATLQSNQALGLNQAGDTIRGGGAIFNAGGSITVEFSTFAGNVAANNDQVDDQGIHGGGLASDGGTVMFDTVAMSENQVGRSAGETQEGETVPELPGLGGALYVGDGATLEIHTSSLIQNTAVAAGGGLWSAAGTSQTPANIVNTDFLANQAAEGGGLYYDQGEAVINGGRLSVNQGNSQEGSGGGIFNADVATLTINDAQIGRNSAAFGGGIDNAGTLNLNRVFLGATQTESRNQAGDNGGGLRNTGTATIDDSTIAFNDAGAGDLVDNSGGGIWNDGTLTVTNSTFADNRARNGGDGGALFQTGNGNATLNFVTVAGNSAEGDGAGVFADGESSVTTVSSILAGTPEGDVGDDGNSLFTVSGLDDLKLFGGPLPTRPLTADSEAVDFVAECTEDADQRGAERPDGDSSGSGDCDSGSFERTGAPVLSVERNGPEQISVGTGGDVAIGEDLVVLAFSLTNDGDDGVNVEGFNTRPLFNGGIGALQRLLQNDPETLGQLTFDVILDDDGDGVLDDAEESNMAIGTSNDLGRTFQFDGGAGRSLASGVSEDFLVVARLDDSQTVGLSVTTPIFAGGLLLGLLGLIRIRGLRRRVQWSFLVLLLTVGLAACSESTGIDELEPPAPSVPQTPDPTLQGSLRFELFQLTPGTGEGAILVGDGLPVYGPAIGLQ